MEPIISIYDMLMKRHRLQRKEEHLSPKLQAQGRRQADAAQSSVERSSDALKPRWRTSPTKADEPVGRTANHVITAAHLTQKPAGNRLTPRKKDVMQQYLGKLAVKKQKTVATSTTNSNLTDTTNSSSTALAKKMKQAVRLKPKGNKTMRSGSSNSRKRLVLSPRNTNRLTSTAGKRDKAAKAKSPTESKMPTTPKIGNSTRPKMRLQKRISKISLKSKVGPTSSIENVVRYGF